MFVTMIVMSAVWSGLTEVDIVNLFAALFDSIMEAFANSDTAAVVSALTGA